MLNGKPNKTVVTVIAAAAAGTALVVASKKSYHSQEPSKEEIEESFEKIKSCLGYNPFTKDALLVRSICIALQRNGFDVKMGYIHDGIRFAKDEKEDFSHINTFAKTHNLQKECESIKIFLKQN